MQSTDVHTATIAVIVLTVNQKAVTLRCLSSFDLVRHPSFEILVWDNGSQDDTAEAIRERFPKVLVHHHPTNLGAAAGRNAAAKLAVSTFNPSHLLFIDNDTVVTAEFLEALLAPFEADKELGQTVPKIRLLKDEQRLDQAGCKIQFWLGRCENVGFGEIDRGQYDKRRSCISGGVFLLPTTVFNLVGGFDPQFDPYGSEDLDFSLRLHRAGYYSLYIPESLIFHDRTQTFEKGKYTQNYGRYKARNWFLLMRRHATVLEKIGFALIGAPCAVVRVLLREGKNGNIAGMRGVICGGLRSLIQRSNPQVNR